MQPQYRNYPMANQRSPHANVAAGRRGPQAMMNPGQPGPPISAAQAQAQSHAEHARLRQAIEDARRRANRPVDKNIPPGVEDIAIGDGVERYQSLQEVERSLDSAITRKRLDIKDSVYRAPNKHRILRVWISNTVENQPWQATGIDPDAFDFNSAIEPTFRVKIQGRLLEDDETPLTAEEDPSQANGSENAIEDDENAEGERAAKRTKLTSAPLGTRNKLSQFFRNIVIDFDRSRDLQPDGFTQIEWKRPDRNQFDPVTDETEFNCIEFERKSDENINVTISMVRDEAPDRYELSKPLAALLDMQVGNRQTVLMGIWEYIKANGLHEDEENRRVHCDEALGKVFSTDQIFYPGLPELIRSHLTPLPPVVLAYTIRVDREFHTPGPPEPTIYDIPVVIEDPLQTQMRALTQSKTHLNALRDLQNIDAELVKTILEMTQSKAKHDFFTSLSTDPANFVKRWISSQKRDLDVLMGLGPWSNDDWETAAWRKGGKDGPWASEEAWEGVGSYMSRTRAGHDFRGQA